MYNPKQPSSRHSLHDPSATPHLKSFQASISNNGLQKKKNPFNQWHLVYQSGAGMVSDTNLNSRVPNRTFKKDTFLSNSTIKITNSNVAKGFEKIALQRRYTNG